MADNKYRFNKDVIAKSFRTLLARRPCKLNIFRNNFKPLQNCLWKNDDFASCDLFYKKYQYYSYL